MIRTIVLLYEAPVLELGSLDVSMQVVELLLRLVVQSHHLLLERADRLHAAPLQALLLRQLLLELQVLRLELTDALLHVGLKPPQRARLAAALALQLLYLVL